MKKISFLPVLALVIAFAASAFTRHTTTTQWHFEGTQLSGARISSQYSQDLGSVNCGGSNLPCIIDVPDDPSRTDEQDLDAYLASFNSDQAVVNAATSKKN
jgi:hypothetical protein